MQNADMIIKGNSIFTGAGCAPFPGGVAIKDNKILSVGSDEEISGFIGPDTKIFEFENKLIMPGFIDAHTHYFLGALAANESMCTDIIASTSESHCIEMMLEFSEKHSEEERIMGMGWYLANWGNGELPSKHSLDKAFPDKPVYLIAADVHTIWLNSLALEECGITEETKVGSGEIGKLDNGELSGLLFELEPESIALDKILDMPLEKARAMHKNFLSEVAKNGVTSISEMTSLDYTEGNHKTYKDIHELEDSGDLTARLHLYPKLEGYTDFSKALKLKDEFCSEVFRMNGVKGFVDGVACTYTAYMLEPYSDRSDTCGEGVPLISKEKLQECIVAANKAGLPVRLHCIGDAAVRMALDVYEISNRENPGHGLNNTIEHIETIDPVDINRFAELGVIPSLQPYHLVLDMDEKPVRVGPERCRYAWALKSILDSGATLAIGTDYPVVDMNPFPNLYAAVTRLADDCKTPASLNPNETITLTEALVAYTKNAAAAYMRDDIGELAPGKLADIVVVDRDLFSVPSEEIHDASVLMTIMDGRIVYQKD